jgi:N-acetyl-anhydromuramyl-L-alanine amidase AmpD
MKRHKTREMERDRISRQDEVETLIVDLHINEASSFYDLQTLTCSCHYLHEARDQLDSLVLLHRRIYVCTASSSRHEDDAELDICVSLSLFDQYFFRRKGFIGFPISATQ